MARQPKQAKLTLTQQINKSFVDNLKAASPEAQKDAMMTYRRYASNLGRLPFKGNEIMQNADHLITRVYPIHVGRLCMYYYNPKLQKTLPYYDRFPLTMPIEIYSDGFLGLNFHYLPPRQRAILMDQIMTRVIKNTHLNKKQRIFLSYRIMKLTVKAPQFLPCIKRYLYSHLRSKIYVLEPESWNMALFLPLERFEKASMARVHNESMRKIRNYGSF